MILRTLTIVLISSGSIASANCTQTMVVDDSKIITLGAGVGLDSELYGKSCGAVEAMRTAVFVDHLSGISDATFSTYELWSAARNDLARQIAAQRARLTAERAKGINTQNWARLKNSSLSLLGAGFTLLGCPTTLSGIGAVSCAGGLLLSAYGTYEGLAADGFDAAAIEIERQLAAMEAMLLQQEKLGTSILDESRRAYLARFQTMCLVVREQCQ